MYETLVPNHGTLVPNRDNLMLIRGQALDN